MTARAADRGAVAARLAALAGTSIAALAAQILPATMPDQTWPLHALRVGITGAWLTLLGVTVAEALTLLARRPAAHELPDWRCAVLITALILPRFRDSLWHAPVAAFWVVTLLVCGAAVMREVGSARALRAYWLGCAVLVAPWGLLPALPRWP